MTSKTKKKSEAVEEAEAVQPEAEVISETAEIEAVQPEAEESVETAEHEPVQFDGRPHVIAVQKEREDVCLIKLTRRRTETSEGETVKPVAEEIAAEQEPVPPSSEETV